MFFFTLILTSQPNNFEKLEPRFELIHFLQLFTHKFGPILSTARTIITQFTTA